MKQTKTVITLKDNIADTLFIPLYMRCLENREEHPIFRDSFACKLVDKIDFDFSKYDGAKKSATGVAIRARYFDEMTKQFIEKNENPVIVHIGCGLDTRYKRLEPVLAEKVVFYDLDIPEVIDLREKLLPASENNEYLRSSMFDTSWMDEIKNNHPRGQFLFVAEGVLMYFEKDRVESLFADLAARFTSARLLFDVTNSWMCKNSHKHDTVKLTNASFKLDLDDDKEIETWANNIKLEEVAYYSDFEEWKRGGLFLYWLMKLIPKFKNSSRILQVSIDW